MSFKKRPSKYGFGSPSLTGRSQLSSSPAGSTGVDLRSEFDKLVFGTGDCPRQGHPIQIWKTRRSADGEPQACVCLNDLTRDPDIHCKYCRGVGYYWDGSWTLTRNVWVSSSGGLAAKEKMSQPGYVDSESKVFYLRYDIGIRMGDFIAECLLDEEGEVTLDYQDQPIVTSIYRPQTVAGRRGKNGRIEYYAVYCLERNSVRPNVFTS